MRYPYASWNDLDRTLEAYKYARRSLLVVMVAALPFAAWDAVSTDQVTTSPDTGTVQTVKHLESVGQVMPLVLPVQHLEAADGCEVPTRWTDDSAV
jgi:hypothetical protein